MTTTHVLATPAAMAAPNVAHPQYPWIFAVHAEDLGRVGRGDHHEYVVTFSPVTWDVTEKPVYAEITRPTELTHA